MTFISSVKKYFLDWKYIGVFWKLFAEKLYELRINKNVEIKIMETNSIPQNQTSVLPTIRSKFSQMTQIQQQIARYILDQPARVLKMSITQLTKATDAKSESAIVRFYKALGFSGYNDFRVDLATEIAGKSFYYTYDDITIEDDVETIKEKMFQGTMRILHENMTALHRDVLQSAVEILESAKRIIFLGYGTAGIVAFDGFLNSPN